MDIKKVKAAIENAHKELNTVMDAQFKARQVNGLRTLTLAANALALAEKHLDRAVEQATRVKGAAVEETTQAVAAGAKAGK